MAIPHSWKEAGLGSSTPSPTTGRCSQDDLPTGPVWVRREHQGGRAVPAGVRLAADIRLSGVVLCIERVDKPRAKNQLAQIHNTTPLSSPVPAAKRTRAGPLVLPTHPHTWKVILAARVPVVGDGVLDPNPASFQGCGMAIQ